MREDLLAEDLVSFQATARVDTSSPALEPGVSGLSISLVGGHEIHENQPDFSGLQPLSGN